MLDAIRKRAGGWVAQLLLGILVLSFAVWGVADIFTGFGSDSIAQVGSTRISTTDFRRSYEQAVQALGRQFGQPLTDEQAQQLRVPGQVLGRLVTEATLDDAAKDMGLGVSDKTLVSLIAEDPNFEGPTGAFDRSYFVQVVRQLGFTEDQFIHSQRAAYVRRQLGQALIGGTEAPEAYLQAVHEYRTEERKISYLILTEALAGTIGEPSPADLDTFYQAHKEDYQAPEFRAVSYMVLSPSTIAKPEEVSDADAQAEYDRSVATRFTTAERRKVEQVVFKDRAEADAAYGGLTSGKTFDHLMTERKLKPEDVDLGLVTRDKIIDAKVAEAAFGLTSGATSPVIDGQFGPVIVRVTTIEPRKVVPFEEAKADIKKEIATRSAAAEIAETHDAVEDSRAGGDRIADVAPKYDLKLVTVPAVDGTGKDPQGADVPDLPAKDQLIAGVFETDVGNDNDPVRTVDNGYVWYEVTGVTPTRERLLDEVKDKVVAAWKEAEQEKKLSAKADEIVARLKSGEDIAKAAGELGLEVKTAEKITRSTQPTGDLSASAINGAFTGPKGSAGSADGTAAGVRLVFVVTERTVPPYFSGAPDMADTKDEMVGQLTNNLLQFYVAELQRNLDVSVNQSAIQQALGLPGS